MTYRLSLLLVAVFGVWLTAITGLLAQEQYPLEISLSGPAGAYDLKRWKQDWPGCKYEDGISEGRVALVESSNLKWLRVNCRANEIGPAQGGIGWRRPIPAEDRVELAYQVRFAENFDFAKGGKLPGLCGGPESVTGGNRANGKNGFSARFMWQPDGRVAAYLYHMDQPGQYGEIVPFPDDIRLPRNKPCMLIMRVGMNEIGEADGSFEAWIKLGEETASKIISRTEMRWRSDESLQVDSLLCEVFHGGNDASWAPKHDCTVDVGEFRLFQ